MFDLSKIFDLGKIFALPDALLKSKNYSLQMFCHSPSLLETMIQLILPPPKRRIFEQFLKFPKFIPILFLYFRGHENVTLTLSWNVIPNAGNLPRISATGSHSFPFPVDYTATRVMQVPLKNCLKFCLLKKIDTKTSFWHICILYFLSYMSLLIESVQDY